MLKLLQVLEAELKTLSQVDKVRSISKIKELKYFSKYAISYEIINNKPYKQRKGKNETPLFINCYSNVDNGDMAVLSLVEDVKSLLDEAYLSDASLDIKTYMVKIEESSPQPEMNSVLQAWQSVVKVNIRWEEV
jgi:hypothetical protein